MERLRKRTWRGEANSKTISTPTTFNGTAFSVEMSNTLEKDCAFREQSWKAANHGSQLRDLNAVTQGCVGLLSCGHGHRPGGLAVWRAGLGLSQGGRPPATVKAPTYNFLRTVVRELNNSSGLSSEEWSRSKSSSHSML
jgi:hypothetical protein